MAVYWGLFALLLPVTAWVGVSLTRDVPAPEWVRIYGAKYVPNYPLPLRISLESLANVPAFDSGQSLAVRISDAQMRTVEKLAQLSDDRSAVLTFPGPYVPPLTVQVNRGKDVLAKGRLQFPSSFHEQLTRYPGQIRGRARGALLIAAGSREGRFVLGRPTELLLETRHREAQPQRATVKLEMQGLETSNGATQLSVITDEKGRAAVPVVPRDFSLSFRATVADGAGQQGEYHAEVEVQSLSFFGRRVAEAIEVQSLISVDSLDYAVVTELGLFARGKVTLACVTNGNCRGRVASEPFPKEPAWLVLGREAALDGKSHVGWSLSDCDGPCETVTFHEAVLLDGRHDVLVSHRRSEQAHARRILAVCTVSGVAFLTVVALLLLRARHIGVELASRPNEEERLPLRSMTFGLLWWCLLGGALTALGLWIAVQVLK